MIGITSYYKNISKKSHPKRSEGSHSIDSQRFFTAFRMTSHTDSSLYGKAHRLPKDRSILKTPQSYSPSADCGSKPGPLKTPALQ